MHSESWRTLIHDRVEAARRGDNPAVIAHVASGWVVLGDRQFLRGYCLLLADPVVGSLNTLSIEERAQFLTDMTAVGDALLAATDAVRINYSILGNAEPALHAHLHPRYSHEPEGHRQRPVWSYPRERREALPFDCERDRPLMTALQRELARTGHVIDPKT